MAAPYVSIFGREKENVVVDQGATNRDHRRIP